jgi:hypothetical protein
VDVPADDGVPVTLFLALRHRAGSRVALHEAVRNVSDPRLPTYGQHFSIEEVADLGTGFFFFRCPYPSLRTCLPSPLPS